MKDEQDVPNEEVDIIVIQDFHSELLEEGEVSKIVESEIIEDVYDDPFVKHLPRRKTFYFSKSKNGALMHYFTRFTFYETGQWDIESSVRNRSRHRARRGRLKLGFVYKRNGIEIPPSNVNNRWSKTSKKTMWKINFGTPDTQNPKRSGQSNYLRDNFDIISNDGAAEIHVNFKNR